MQTNEQFDYQENKIVFGTWRATEPIGQVYLVHGYAEHFRRYERFAKQLNQAGYTVHGFDLPGHGLSGGKRGHIDNFGQYINTLDWFIQNNPNRLKESPTFLFAHSMGGLISSHYLINKENQIKGLILSSPLTGFTGSTAWLTAQFARLLNRQDPSRQIPKPLSAKGLTTLTERFHEYTDDPLRLNTITPSLYLGMILWSQLALQNAKLINTPVLIFFSRADSVVSPEKILSFFHVLGSKDKQIIAFSDAGHELIQDHTEAQVVSKSIHWLNQHQ